MPPGQRTDQPSAPNAELQNPVQIWPIQRRYATLITRAIAFRPDSTVEKQFRDIWHLVLEIFQTVDEENANEIDVSDVIRRLLPAPNFIFVKDKFTAPASSIQASE